LLVFYGHINLLGEKGKKRSFLKNEPKIEINSALKSWRVNEVLMAPLGRKFMRCPLTAARKEKHGSESCTIV